MPNKTTEHIRDRCTQAKKIFRKKKIIGKELDNKIYEPEFVESLFDKMSNSYERINILFSFGFTYMWRREMINKLTKSSKENLEIIDLMTGMGETWELIKRKYPTSTLTGLDISEGMLKRAKKKNKEKFNDRIILIKENVLNNSLKSKKYDVVFSAFGLKTFNKDQIKHLAKEVKRILKPAGEFAFVEISKPSNYLLNLFYELYIGKITPQITKLLLGDPIEYRMLWEYTKRYENSKWIVEIFEEVGLKTQFDNYFFGCGTGIHGLKI